MTSIAFDPQLSAERYMFAGQDVPWLVEHWANKKPDHPFMIWEPKQLLDHQQSRWTYAQFWLDINKIACGLLARGLRKGDKLLVHADNCPEMVLAWYACAVIGAVAVTTNTGCIGDELAYLTCHSDAQACITQSQFVDQLSAFPSDIKWVVVIEDSADATWHQHIPFSDLFNHGEFAPKRAAEPMLPVGIQYTSGTTSRPKAVVHTHANALWGGRSGAQNLLMDGDDVYLTFLPFFHVNAQSWCFWSSLWVGATVVFQPKFSASRFWELSLKYKCTRASMLPFCFKAIGAQEVPTHYYKSWSTGVIIPEVEDWFKVRCFATWGMTETVTHATRSDLLQDSPRMNIGQAAPGYEFAIINSQTREYCQAGENGDLYVRGVRGIQLFYEYYNNTEAMAAAFTQDGWFKTGDRVRIGEDGYFYFADRDKDVIKVGGENVSARQVEECIMQLTACFDEVAVVAKQHDMLDEVPVAFIIKSPWTDKSEEQLRQMLIDHVDQQLADFKRPRAYYFVEDFPRATLKKVAKNKLRDIANAK